MPTYDYQCKDCSHRFDVFQSITAAPLKTCPKCDGTLERIINGGAGLIFKGSGFYLTDYKKNNGEKGDKSEKSTEKPPAKSESTTGEKSSTTSQKSESTT